jgi:uncharacterized protein YjbJ (UPF0337 family)
MNENKDLGTQGTEDTLKGKLNKAAGKVEKKLGQVTDDEEMEAKGQAKEAGGTIQSKLGQAEHKVQEGIDQITERMKHHPEDDDEENDRDRL